MGKKNTKHPPPSPPRQHEGFQHHQYQQLDLDMVGLAMGVAGFHFPCVVPRCPEPCVFGPLRFALATTAPM